MVDKRKEYSRRYYLKHREEIKKKHKKYRQSHRKQYNEHQRKYWKEYRRIHHGEYIKSRRNYYRKLRRFLIDSLGRKCSECGTISQYDCIYDFHHEGHNGWSASSSEKIRQMIKWRKCGIPKDIKLICSNCHRIKTQEERENE